MEPVSYTHLDVYKRQVAQYTAGDDHEEWNLDGLREYYTGWLTTEDDFRYDAQQMEDLGREELTEQLIDKAMKIYEEKETNYGPLDVYKRQLSTLPVWS